MLDSLESCSWRQALPVLSLAAFGSVCLAAGVLLTRQGIRAPGPAAGKPLGEANCEAAAAAKPAAVTAADHPRRGRRLRRDDSAHNPVAHASSAPAAGNRSAGPPTAPEGTAAAASSAEAWSPTAPEAIAAAANSTEAGEPTALEAAANSTVSGAPAASGASAGAVGTAAAGAPAAPEAAADGTDGEVPAAPGTPAAATPGTDMGASTTPEATVAAAGSRDAGPPAAREATSAGSNSLLPLPDLQTAAAAVVDNVGAGCACSFPNTTQRAALDPGQPQKDTAAGVGAQHQPRTSLTGCRVEDQADRLPSMELAHNLLNTGGSEALLTSGESEQWDAELLAGQGRSRDSSLDGAWEALLGLTASGAPRDSLDEQYAPQEAAGRRLNGGMMFPAEGDAFPDEPRLGALATVRRSLDQVGTGCAGCFFSQFWDSRQLDHTCLMGWTSDVRWSAC